MRHIAIIALILLATTSCGSPAPAAAPGEVTRLVEVTVPVEVTRIVKMTVPVEVTRQVTHQVTVIATVTPEPTPIPAAQIARIALAEPVTQDLGGVKITVQQIALMDWAAASRDPEIRKLVDNDAFADAQILGILSLLLENGAASKVNVYGDQGTVVIGSEQIDLSSFMFYSDGEDLGGTFFPGVKSQGSIMFALKHTIWADIAAGAQVIYETNAPSDENYKSLSKQPYRFDLALVPIP